MRLARAIGLLLTAATAVVAGCGGGGSDASETRRTYDYVAAVRPLAYENAHRACSGHSSTSLAFEYAISGSTRAALARAWAMRNQLDARLRGESYRGCRDGLRETAARPGVIERPALTSDEIDAYMAAYATCTGLTVAEVAREYDVDVAGLTVAQAIRAMVRRSYGPAYRDIAENACLAAVRGEPPRYGS
jgi:hypothetical protein